MRVIPPIFYVGQVRVVRNNIKNQLVQPYIAKFDILTYYVRS
jgi:hypothetical protein